MGEKWTFGEVTVREARARDALAVLGIHRMVLEEGEYFITLPHEFGGSLDQKEAQIGELAKAPNGIFLVASINRQVAGFLTIQSGPLSRMASTGKLEIMVRPEHRGAGVGKALLVAGMDWAERTPALHKVGLSVFATNDRALRLYEKFGFEVEGRRAREYRLADGAFRDDVLLFRFV